MASDTHIPVSEYVRRVPAHLRPTLQAARKAVKSNAPKGTTETAWRTWPIRYSKDGIYICAVGDYPRWVSLFFFRGGTLDDPAGVLEGSGKLMRHIKLRTPEDASRPAVKRMIRRAFRVGGIDMRGNTATSSQAR